MGNSECDAPYCKGDEDDTCSCPYEGMNEGEVIAFNAARRARAAADDGTAGE